VSSLPIGCPSLICSPFKLPNSRLVLLTLLYFSRSSFYPEQNQPPGA
jgi:hypothetical protein